MIIWWKISPQPKSTKKKWRQNRKDSLVFSNWLKSSGQSLRSLNLPFLIRHARYWIMHLFCLKNRINKSQSPLGHNAILYKLKIWLYNKIMETTLPYRQQSPNRFQGNNNDKNNKILKFRIIWRKMRPGNWSSDFSDVNSSYSMRKFLRACPQTEQRKISRSKWRYQISNNIWLRPTRKHSICVVSSSCLQKLWTNATLAHYCSWWNHI